MDVNHKTKIQRAVEINSNCRDSNQQIQGEGRSELITGGVRIQLRGIHQDNLRFMEQELIDAAVSFVVLAGYWDR